MRYLALLSIILAATMHAQELPNAPAPQLTDRILMGYAITARALDVASTNQFLGRGGHELYLPRTVVNHPALQVGFEAAVLGAEWLGARELRRHGHPKLARMVWMVDGSAVLATDVRNFEIQRTATVASVAVPVTPIASLNPGAAIVVGPHR